MGVQVKDIKLVHRVVGTKHVYTSPDVPELHISHADQQTALESIQPALDLLEQMKERKAAREAVQEIQRERMYA